MVRFDLLRWLKTKFRLPHRQSANASLRQRKRKSIPERMASHRTLTGRCHQPQWRRSQLAETPCNLSKATRTLSPSTSRLAVAKSPLFAAEKFVERLKKFRNRFRDRFDALGQLGRVTAMNGTGLSRNFISRQNNVVSGTGHLASGRSQRVGSGTDCYPRHRHCRLE